MRKRAIAVLLSAAMVFTAGSWGQRAKTRYSAEFLVLFDTVSQIVAYMDSEEEFRQFSQLVYDRLKEYNDLYDIYNDHPGVNSLKTVNDNAGIAPVVVDRRIIDLLLFAKKEYKETGGKINIAMGSVLKIWHAYRTEGMDDPERAALPSMEELRQASEHTNINNLVIDEAASTVFLKDPEMSLDVGAVGKGYAVEQVSRLAQASGYSSALLSIGGNVRAIGGKGIGRNPPWNVGIQNPDEESTDAYLRVLDIKDLSLVTSGDYERYYTVSGKKYSHIIDPLTLFPAEYCTAVIIVCRDSGLADALSTAVFNMPFEQGLPFVESLPGVEAMWVFPDGTIKCSPNFPKYVRT